MGCANSSPDFDQDPVEINLQRKRNLHSGSEKDHCIKVKDEQQKNYEEHCWFHQNTQATELEVAERIRSLTPGELYEDPDFKCDLSALGLGVFKDLVAVHNLQDVEWLRPQDLCANPKLYVDGVSRTDIIQGSLGDCWLLSACAAIARNPTLIEKVLPPVQPLSGPNYKGVIKVNFWRFGSWVTVFIDDKLPTLKGNLLFSRSSDPAEFWVSLLEKAYAKLKGSYSRLIGGHAVDALVDLTGGLAEIHLLSKNPQDQEEMFDRLLKSTAWGAFITCRRPGDWTNKRKADEKGLVSGHAYTVTGTAVLQIHGRKVPVIRVRNPWGDYEWNGPWSDRDRKSWSAVSREAKKLMEFQEKEDGEFWIGLPDFCKEFEAVCICTVGPDYDIDGATDECQQVNLITGGWVLGCNAGGSRNDPYKFAKNPQFLLSIRFPDDETENDLATLIISLIQSESTNSSKENTLNQIGFFVFEANRSNTRLSKDELYNDDPLVKSGKFVNLREVWKRVQLPTGNYVIVPATFKPDQTADFLIRIFSRTPVQIQAI